MPIFEYHCNHCGANLEELQKHSDPPLIHCLACNQPSLQRAVSKSAFHLKGGGWYKDGYSGSASSNSDSSIEASPSPKESTPSPKTSDNSSSSSDATAA